MKRTSTEHVQVEETLFGTLLHDRVDSNTSNFDSQDAVSGDASVTQPLGELDSAAFRLQSNLDDPDDWSNTDLQHRC